MLDGSWFFECGCGADEHVLKFTLDKNEGDEDGPELFLSIFLNDWLPWYERTWRALKYIFGYKCRYGHWDCWSLERGDVRKFRAMLIEYERAVNQPLRPTVKSG